MLLGVQKSRRSMHLSRTANPPPRASHEALEAGARAYDMASASEGSAAVPGQQHASDMAFFSHAMRCDSSEEGSRSRSASITTVGLTSITSKPIMAVAGLQAQSISAPASNMTAAESVDAQLVLLQPASGRPSEDYTGGIMPSEESAQRNNQNSAVQQAWNDELADVRAEAAVCIKKEAVAAVAAVAAADIDVIAKDATNAVDEDFDDDEETSQQWHEVTATAFIDPESGR